MAYNGPFTAELIETAASLAAPGKGILAADESTATIGKRLTSIGVENNEANRRALRELLFSAPGIGEHISGTILFEETLFQKLDDGTPLISLLAKQGIVPGIKVDKGVVPLPGTDDETSTQGLDDLHKRCAEYRAAGARFAKWRAVLKIGDGCPSALSISANAHGLARYAIICQQNGLVPIVEPEILTDGNHSIERCAAETEKVLAAVMKELSDHHVLLEGILLKPNMVSAGVDAPAATAADVARLTVRALQRTIPPAVAGVCFLSGGQSEEEATVHLDAMNRVPAVRPWPLTFSYGRALQASVLKSWGGKAANVAQAQAVLLARCRANGEAALGKYIPGSAAGDAGAQRQYVADYKY